MRKPTPWLLKKLKNTLNLNLRGGIQTKLTIYLVKQFVNCKSFARVRKQH